MGIESWHEQTKRNPAHWGIEKGKRWCVGQGLDPQTIKTIGSHPLDILSVTALGAATVPGADQLALRYEEMTEWESTQVFGDPCPIDNCSKLAVFDIDGLLVKIWPGIFSFARRWRESPTTRPRRIADYASRAARVTKNPSRFWGPIIEIGRRVDKLVLYSSRPRLPEQLLSYLFPEDILPPFPFMSEKFCAALREKMEIEVIAERKWSCRGREEIVGLIEEMKDPYIVFGVSSLADLWDFTGTIKALRQRELPFDHMVCCVNGHLIF